jgi:hypothetical protein
MHPMTIKKEELKKLAQELKELKRWRKGKPPAESCKNDWDIWKKKKDYRYEHIAYCLVRGRIYEQIENPNEETKHIDNIWHAWDKINKLKDELQIKVDEANAEWLTLHPKKVANE